VKIAILSTFDITGGAFKAAYRLHKGLLHKGHISEMLVSVKTIDDYTVLSNSSKSERIIQKILPFLNKLPLLIYRKRGKELFSPAWTSSPVIKKLKSLEYQIINLQWINDGFISIRTLKKIKQPIVWTLHDMWAFTGGCHYAGSCKKYINGCNKCPQLGSLKENDLSKRIFNRKIRIWKNLNITFISPSKWLADCARQSLILRHYKIEVIPYNIDTNIYKPIDKIIARNIMNLPVGKSIFLFGATDGLNDKRKGISYLLLALNKIPSEKRKDLCLVVFGSSQPEKPLINGFDIFYTGQLKDEITLAIAYSCADVYITPSLEDNLPLTVMESLSCGTPVVAFNIGGMPDLIEHKINGYLATPVDPDDLAAGIQWVIEDPIRKSQLGKTARNIVLENYTTDIIVGKYKQIYSSILS
jgi:glycosyltransferase involved in cell wall biosynthesis